MQCAYRSPYGLIHVMGPQCGETAEQIIERKADDFKRRNAAKTLWAHHSRLATIDMVRRLGARGTVHLYLVADTTGKARKLRMPGQATTSPSRAARHYHPGNREPGGWLPIEDLGISGVTDSCRLLDKGNGWALFLGPLENLMERPEPIRMEDWADITTGSPKPLRTGIGAHVVCAEQRDMRAHPEVWRKERVVIGVAPLVAPFAAWLR